MKHAILPLLLFPVLDGLAPVVLERPTADLLTCRSPMEGTVELETHISCFHPDQPHLQTFLPNDSFRPNLNEIDSVCPHERSVGALVYLLGPHSLNSDGTLLSTTGNPYTDDDTLCLYVTGVPPTTSIFYRMATEASNGGMGVLSNDGVLSNPGCLVRLGQGVAVNGASSLGFVVEADPLVSVRGRRAPQQTCDQSDPCAAPSRGRRTRLRYAPLRRMAVGLATARSHRRDW